MFKRKRKMFLKIVNTEKEAKLLVYIWENILKLNNNRYNKYTLKYFKPFIIKKEKCNCNYYIVYYFV